MADEGLYGLAQNGAIGDKLSNEKEAAARKVDKAKAVARDAYGKVKEEATRFRAKAGDGYSRAASQAKTQLGELEGHVRERPMAAIGLVAGVGVLVGLLLAAAGGSHRR